MRYLGILILLIFVNFAIAAPQGERDDDIIGKGIDVVHDVVQGASDIVRTAGTGAAKVLKVSGHGVADLVGAVGRGIGDLFVPDEHEKTNLNKRHWPHQSIEKSGPSTEAVNGKEEDKVTESISKFWKGLGKAPIQTSQKKAGAAEEEKEMLHNSITDEKRRADVIGVNEVKTATRKLANADSHSQPDITGQRSANGIESEGPTTENFDKGGSKKVSHIKQGLGKLSKIDESVSTHSVETDAKELTDASASECQGSSDDVKCEGEKTNSLNDNSSQTLSDIAASIKQRLANVFGTQEESADCTDEKHVERGTKENAPDGREQSEIAKSQKDQKTDTLDENGSQKLSDKATFVKQGNAKASFNKREQNKLELADGKKQDRENVVKTTMEAAAHLNESKEKELPKIFPIKDQVPAGGIKIEGNGGATFGK
ncbi:hypothetical protein Bhyg_08889, partial [Pseudolycoriella hygida]